MAIRIPRTTRTRQVRLPQTNNLRLVQATRTDLADDIGSAINNLGQRILDVENEKAKIRVQNDIINAESELSREIQKKNNELFQSGYDFSPKTIKDKIQEGKDFIDDFLNKKFPDRPEAQKYFGKLKFDAYKLNEKFLYENSNKVFQKQTISTHEDNLTSLAESIEAQTPGSAMFSNFYSKIESLDLSRKNANNVGANYDKEEEEKKFKLLIMKKILSKNSFIDPITEQRVLDYKTIRANLNSLDFTSIGGEELTDDLRGELKEYYKDGDQRFKQYLSNYIKTENTKAFAETEKIRGIKDLSLSEQLDRVRKQRFVGKEGEEIKKSVIGVIENEIERGVITPTTVSERVRVDDLIINGVVTSLFDKQVVDDDILENLKKQKIIDETASAVSLIDMQRGGLLTKEDVKISGYFDNKIKRIADPLKKEQDKAFKEFLDRVKPSILGSNQNKLAESSPTAVKRFSQAYLKLSERFEEGLAEGKTAKQLLTAGTPDYIYVEEPLLTNRGGFRPTQQEITRETQEAFGATFRSKEDKELTEKQLITKDINELKEIIIRIKKLDKLTTDEVKGLPAYKKMIDLIEKRKSE
tara:strand:+ start:501 stop:2252 length:1752 start_codon:yes stop_codon:yes gene_type:complete